MIYHGLSALHILMEHQSNTTEKGDPFSPELLDRDLYTIIFITIFCLLFLLKSKKQMILY